MACSSAGSAAPAEAAGAGAGGDDDGMALDARAVLLADDDLGVAVVLDGGHGLVVELGACGLGLLEHLDGELGAVDGAHAQVVGDFVGVDDLAAGRELVEQQGLHVGSDGVYGGGEAGGAGADDDNVVLVAVHAGTSKEG